jgi:hypothetical protein
MFLRNVVSILRRYMPEYGSIHNRRCEYHKSYTDYGRFLPDSFRFIFHNHLMIHHK